MSQFFLSVMFVVVLGIAGSALAQGFRVVVIDETPGRTMNAGTFASAAPESVKKYMPEGTALASVSTFILFAGEDIILFDAGLGNEFWEKLLTDAGVKYQNVKFVLLTHSHGDHVGGLLKDDARRFPNAKVLVSTLEYEFWLLQEGQPRGAKLARIRAAYGQDFVKFEFDDEVAANPLVKVKALDAVGHTPGHTAFLVESPQEGKERLLIVGDLIHAAALQFPVPEACASFDMDQEKAIASRKRILDFAIENNLPIGGMHFPPPSVGTVKKEVNGYSFEMKK